MPSSLAVAVRERLSAFAWQEASLTELYDWLMDHVVSTGAEQLDAELRAVLGHTILYLYEYQDHYRSREEIRSYVAGLLAPVVEAPVRTVPPSSLRA